MIALFEVFWRNAAHAPGNASMIKILAYAFPDQPILYHAAHEQLEEVRRAIDPAAFPQVSFCPIAVPEAKGDSVSNTLPATWRILRSLRAAKIGSHDLVVLCYGSPMAILAARAFHALHPRRRPAFHIRLHGNLNEILGWRSRNPLSRAVDLRAALTRGGGPRRRFIVLESHIQSRITELLPEIRPHLDLLPEAIIPEETEGFAPLAPVPPIRVATLGLQTHAKGFGLYLDLARRLSARHPGQIEFHAIGRLHPQVADLDTGPLAHEIGSAYLSRADFIARLACMHYVCLPFRTGYYDLSASGVLIDALGLRKPLITLRVPLMVELFDRFGDIGELCADEAALERALERSISAPDPERYARQLRNLEAARASRLPERLAEEYRRIVIEKFPAFAARA
jgi:hypothetical protein